MAGIHVREGNVTVKLSDDLEVLARRALEEVAPGVMRALEEEAERVRNDAYRAWPVRTGVSREGLRAVTEITLDGDVRAAVRNDVDYAPYIRPLSLHGATTAWQRWVRAPMTEAHKRLVRELGPIIIAALRGRRG
jgi:hypothetical protein